MQQQQANPPPSMNSSILTPDSSNMDTQVMVIEKKRVTFSEQPVKVIPPEKKIGWRTRFHHKVFSFASKAKDMIHSSK